MAFGWDKKEVCDVCGEEVRNLGLHKYHKHREKVEPGTIVMVDNVNDIVEPTISPIKIDEILQVPLSEVVCGIKNILRQFQNSMEVKISEQNGKPFEVQIVTIIKL
jgi:hypothetical protein